MTDTSIKIEIDQTSDLAYIRLSDNDVSSTVEVSEAILVDLDEFGVAVGIEVLELGADLPFTDLVERFHVRSDVVSVLRLIRPSVSGFMSMMQAPDGTSSPSRLHQPIG